MEQEQDCQQGGYPCDMFVTPPPDDLKCSICMEVLKDPLQVCSEQHNYCRGCIGQWKGGGCPGCRAPISTEQPARLARNMILHLEVRCSQACEWTGPFQDREIHAAACPLVEVPCPFADAGCGFRAARRDMGAHSSDAIAHIILLTTAFAAVKAECASVKGESAAIKAQRAATKSDISSLQHYLSILHTPREEAGEWVSSLTVPAATGHEEFTYTGQMRGGARHGFGRASYSGTGTYVSYDGQWREDKKCGQGITR
jgi:hypothetical protein